MKRTKVIRADQEFAELLETGRRITQAASGKRTSITSYTEQLALLMRPLVSVEEQARRAKKA